MKPNKYQVTYNTVKMGVWTSKTHIIETLGDCINFDNIIKVNHVYHALEIYDEIPLISVGLAVADREKAIQERVKQERITQLKNELKKLENE